MNIIKHLDALTARVVSALEAERSTVPSAVLTFCFFTTIRTGLEQFSDQLALSAVVFAHYTLCYVSLASSIVLVFHLISKVEVVKVLKVVLPAFAILIVVPLIDALAPSSGASNLSYFGPGSHDPLAELFAFGTAQGTDGATLGVRVEISTMMIASVLYGRNKGLGIVRSGLLAIALYVVIFLHGLLPFAMRWSTELLGHLYLYSDRLAAYYYLLVLPITVPAILYLASRECFVAVVRDLRYLRLAHFLLMFAIGLALGFKDSPRVVTILTVFEILMVPIALVCAAVFAIVSNNVEDRKIDAISNPDRPLVSGAVDEKAYVRTGWWCLAAGLFYGALSGFRTFFAILFVTATYYLYSAPPVRFKRVLVLSKLVISLNSLAMMLLGWVLAGRHLDAFPRPIIAYVLIGFTLATNFIDLKDHRGDREGKIQTLPVRFGLRTAKRLVAASFVVVYVGAFALFESAYWLMPIAFVATLQGALIVRKQYREAPVFGVYLASVAVLLIYIMHFSDASLAGKLTWEGILGPR